MKTIINAFFLVILLVTVHSSRRLFIPDATFNVLDYGAKGDGHTLDTDAIQSAFKAAAKAGGGTVLFPKGYTFLTFPFSFESSNTNLQVEGGSTIKASDDISKWPVSGDAYISFITAKKLKDISITGTGIIDGQGAPWWDAFHNNTLKYTRPDLVNYSGCSSCLFSHTSFVNSPNHNLEIQCTDLEVGFVSITAPQRSPNTDGIDVHGSRSWIHDSYISVGDDHIAQHSNDTVVENCQFGYGHGASIGAFELEYIQNVTFRNITVKGADQAIRIKAPPGAGGLVRDIVYENFQTTDVKTEIIITMFYESSKVVKTDLKIYNITISDVTGTGGQNAGTFDCQPSSPCTGIHLKNINFNSGIKPFSCDNAFGDQSNVNPNSCLKS
eukprot:TRINITY_DN597_c0_g2_i1.p1 TRINITY_DN597_c0_g2~~TRINITY_DN597_c0_g2_i1.p1  ORF type:complete len:397 (-),score=70.65 TRINITY_DN597_c0_g2_i1:5-1153(-)